MITYEWNCRTVDVYPTKEGKTDVVYNVHYQVSGEHNETAVIGYFIGTQVLNTDNIENFTDFSSLTNDQVATWVKTALGAERVLDIENNIKNQIKEKENPTSVTMTIGASFDEEE
jgi:hypothetical protein